MSPIDLFICGTLYRLFGGIMALMSIVGFVVGMTMFWEGPQ